MIITTKYITGKNITYKAYYLQDGKFYYATEEQLAALDPKLRINFKVSGGKVVEGFDGFNPSIIKNGEFIKSNYTIIGINNKNTELKLITPKDEIITMSIEEFRGKLDSLEFNNLYINDKDGDRVLIVKKTGGKGNRYIRIKLDSCNNDDKEEVDKSCSNIDLREVANEGSIKSPNTIESTIEFIDKEEKNRVDEAESVEELDNGCCNENGGIKVDNHCDIVEDAPEFDILAEIERIENEVLDDEEIGDTEGEIQDANQINDYREIIWNMYPNDRITIQAELFKGYSSVILRILDSSVDGVSRISLTKIYKQDRSKCTYAIVNENSISDTVTIQVLGQSDIPEKSLETDLEGICLKYASWLRQTKYIKL